MRQTASMVALLFAAIAGAVAGHEGWMSRGSKNGKDGGFLAAVGRMQPTVAARSLSRVEGQWLSEVLQFTECNGQSSRGDCSQSPKAFEKSCGTIVTAVVSASSGDRDTVKEYMGVVCGEPELQGWKHESCKHFAKSITDTMTADSWNNREQLDVPGLCVRFWTDMLAFEASRVMEEHEEEAEHLKAERAEAAEQAKRRAAEAAAKEDARKAAADADAAVETKRKQAEDQQRQVAQQRRKAEAANAAAKAAEEAKQAAAKARAARKKSASKQKATKTVAARKPVAAKKKALTKRAASDKRVVPTKMAGAANKTPGTMRPAAKTGAAAVAKEPSTVKATGINTDTKKMTVAVQKRGKHAAVSDAAERESAEEEEDEVDKELRKAEQEEEETRRNIAQAQSEAAQLHHAALLRKVKKA